MAEELLRKGTTDRYSFHALKKWNELGVAFDDNCSAPLGYQRGIADKLDGVAETLLGMQQDGAAIEAENRPTAGRPYDGTGR